MTSTLSIQVTSRAGATETVTVEGQRLRLGSAAHCEIRLPVEEAAAEHVALEDRGISGLYAEALSFQPEPTINGVPFSVARLEPTAVLAIGSTKIQASIASSAGATDKQAAPRKTSPLVYVAALATMAFSAAESLFDSEDEGLKSARTAPPLFAEAPVTCPQTEADSAHALAQQELARAEAKRERRPFYAGDGVQAVALFRRSAACFAVASAAEEVEHAQHAAVALERDLDESYRTHRLRLDHALSVKDFAVARREARKLLELLHGRSGEYVTWVSSLDRRLKLKQEQKPEKSK